MIQKNGGQVNKEDVIIKTQAPEPVRFEKSFEGLYPVAKTKFRGTSTPEEITFNFKGTGFALRGHSAKNQYEIPEYEFNVEMYIDGKKMESAVLPTSFVTRRYELFWKYGLEDKDHEVTIKILNPNKDYELRIGELLIYSDKPLKTVSAK